MEQYLNKKLRSVLPLLQDGIQHGTTFMGVRTLKNPLDAWIYQEIIFETKPDLIVEIGNAYGGGLLYLASLCDLMEWGIVVGVDIDHSGIDQKVREHPRIRLIHGDIGTPSVARAVHAVAVGKKHVLIIDDGSHKRNEVLFGLRLLSNLIPIGGYYIIEDSVCHHGLDIGPDPGPHEAITVFLEENDSFESDRSRERLVITWNSGGFLKRVK